MERSGGDGPLPAILAGADKGVTEALDHLLKVSNENAPKDHGDLVSSGNTVQHGTAGTVFYTADHALAQHERLDYKHPSGGSAKYLESAMSTEATKTMQIIQDNIQAKLR